LVHFPLADPRKPVKIPARLDVKSLAHIAWLRLFPMRWTFPVAACVSWRCRGWPIGPGAG
jgi:hypothetical protein